MPFKNNPPAYGVWASMKDRCKNRNCRSWPNYGGRGIGYCERWESYSEWAKDMLPRLPGFSLERIDNDADYSPENCYWADKKAQQRNRRVAAYVEIEGVRYRAIELAEQIGVKADTIIDRARRGMTYDEVMFSGRYVDTSGFSAGTSARIAKARDRTHCKRGHPYETYASFTPQGWRTCRECHRQKVARQMAAKRARVPAGQR